MGIVNAELLARVADSIDIGCDVLHFGNRQIEKSLGAENMSGDTVYITEADGGAEFDGIDCSGSIGSCGVSRARLPLQVGVKGCIYELSQAQRDLMVKDGEFADKMMARFIDGRNAEAYGCISGACTASAVDKTSGVIKSDDIVNAFYDALAGIEASKIKGKVFGIGNGLSLNAMTKGLAQGTGIGMYNKGNELWKRGLANFAGMDWSKSGVLGRVQDTIQPTKLTAYTVADDANFAGNVSGSAFKVITHVTLTGTAGGAVGDAVQPFLVEGWDLCDVLGNDTGLQISLEGTVSAVSGTSYTVKLANPVRFQALDPFRNVYGSINTSSTASLNVDVTPVLTGGKTYLNPVLLSSDDEFYVAVKGLEAMKAKDSATVPSGFGDKGILPIRGTAWSDPKTSVTYARFDAMFGYMMKRGIASRKIYIEA